MYLCVHVSIFLFQLDAIMERGNSSARKAASYKEDSRAHLGIALREAAIKTIDVLHKIYFLGNCNRLESCDKEEVTIIIKALSYVATNASYYCS